MVVYEKTMSYAEAQVISEPDVQRKIVEQILTQDKFLPFVPAVPYHGDGFKWYHEKTLGERLTTEGGANSGAQADAEMRIDYDDEIPEHSVDFNTELVRSVEYALRVRVSERLQAELTDQFDIGQVQVLSAMKRMSRAYHREFWSLVGDGSNKTFDGINSLLDLEAVVGAHREALTGNPLQKQQSIVASATSSAGPYWVLPDFDKLIGRVLTGNVSCLVMKEWGIRELRRLVRAESGGLLPVNMTVPGTGQTLAEPSYEGIPVLRCDFIPETRPDAYGRDAGATDNESSIFAFDLASDEGVRTLHFINEGKAPGAWKLTDLGPSQTKNQHSYRLVFNGRPIVFSLRTVARLDISRFEG